MVLSELVDIIRIDRWTQSIFEGAFPTDQLMKKLCLTWRHQRVIVLWKYDI